MTLPSCVRHRLYAARTKLQQNHLWQRMVKHSLATIIAVIIVIIPAVRKVYGSSIYLAAMTSVFGHCARPFGQMAESLVLIIAGIVVGLGWATLGMYLSSLVLEENSPAAYTIRALFLVILTLAHGYIRSHSPRLFVMCWIFFLTGLSTLVSTSTHVTASTVTPILLPMFTTMGVLLLVNVLVFPEFSGRFLADNTIQTLGQTQTTLKAATEWFMEPSAPDQDEDTDPEPYGPGSLHKSRSKPVSLAKSASRPTRISKLATLTGAKTKLRAKLSSCKAALKECLYEIEYAVLPSRSLKPISRTTMTGLVRNVTTMISACESKFVMMDSAKSGHPASTASDSEREDSEESPEDEDRAVSGAKQPQSIPVSRRTSIESRLEHVKPQREIASGDPEILDALLARVRRPVRDLLAQIDTAIPLVMTCLAYCYDVEKPPLGILKPKGLGLEEVDIRVDTFADALASFDITFQKALGKMADVERQYGEVDVMPRIETFLLSSSLLSLRHAAEQVMQMLKHARTLVARRQARNNRKRLYWPRKVNWQRWLRSGGEEDVNVLPENARKEVRTGQDDTKKGNKRKQDTADDDSASDPEDETPAKKDEEANPPAKSPTQEPRPKRPSKGRHTAGSCPPKRYSFLWWRGQAADFAEAALHSEDLAYALKLTVAVFSICWIPFYGPFNSWFTSMRGMWAPLQLVLVFEVAIGPSFWTFFTRMAGVVFGCTWGYMSFEASRGQLPALVVILAPGIIASTYVQLGTPYVKAGMISIVSMCIVALASVQGPGAAWENFVKRLVNFVIGGTVALIVEVTLYPVKARDRLVESLSSTIHHIARMEGAIATGSESPAKVTTLQSTAFNARFQRATAQAETALSAAGAILPFCLSEPRLKGSFKALEPIYREIIYVLHQIIDRMDNSISLRRAYGSSVLEDMNHSVYKYRRNVAAAITLTLFAVNEALTTKLPLPQFLPSCRLAQMRLVNRVREVIQTEQDQQHRQHQQQHYQQQQSSLIRGVLASSKLRMPSPAGHRLSHHAHTSGASTPTAKTEDPSTAIPITPTTTTATYNNATTTQKKFLSWSAGAAGQMEIIEYLEELVDLTKLLVGVNAFRSGMLDRPSYRNYVAQLKSREKGAAKPGPDRRRYGADGVEDGDGDDDDENDDRMYGGGVISPVASAPTAGLRRRGRRGTGSSTATSAGMYRTRSLTERFKLSLSRSRGEAAVVDGEEEEEEEEKEEVDDLPPSLQRIGTRFGRRESLAREE